MPTQRLRPSDRSRRIRRTLALKSFHTMRRVLVVDDEENIRLVLRTLLKKHGYEVEVADSGEAALALLDTFDPDVILTDVRMPRMGGLDLLATLKAKQHPATVIVMSAYGNVDLAIEAMKAGAYDYVSKPFKPDEIVLALRKAEERETLRRENRALREQIQKENQFESILAKSPQMLDIFRTISKIADFKTTVLITGESGIGKELVARAIHARVDPQGGAVRRHQLRRHPREPARERALRAQEGRVHRRHRRPPRPLRGGPRRHALPRRDWRAPAQPPGEAPPRRCRRRRIRRLGDTQGHQGRRPHHRRDAPRPRGRREGRPLPRGPLLPHQRARRLHIPPLREPPRGRQPAHRPLRRAQQRAPRDQHPRRLAPRRASSSSSTPGPATCASSRTPSSAPWCSPRRDMLADRRPARAHPRGARSGAGAPGERRAVDQEDDARPSSRSSSAARCRRPRATARARRSCSRSATGRCSTRSRTTRSPTFSRLPEALSCAP